MVEEIKKNLINSFTMNPYFEPKNIDVNLTVENRIFDFLKKFMSLFQNIDLKSFYEKMKTFKLEKLSKFANHGYAHYDEVENIGYLSGEIFDEKDDERFNVDYFFGYILVSVVTCGAK